MHSFRSLPLASILAAGCAGSNLVAPAPEPALAVTPAPAATPPAPAARDASPGRPVPASPSRGCGRAKQAAGMLVARAGKLSTPYLLTLPTAYDGTQPVPLVF